ncbi:YjbF family lipoprotein [Pseudotabrizicola algicola]|uniref:YjbF family lipoprotein n=1 Tax=Pseudotabrizicola algicola TaxID=2709381 RepID=A0A6B3RY41_9RHOB|nr:YjbF family lipoprotein [Pseudotabrizicola algicola]NEX48049.1 YjbF family lipoprotein [Pseudotabrizicola algicola]
MKTTLVLGLLACTTLVACGSDSDSIGTADIVRSFATSAIGTLSPADAGIERMTRARLAEVVTPVMLLTVDSTGQEALIAEIENNRGVETWSTVDDITISLRNGVIVATRGFGADLMAASGPNVTRSGGSYGRVHVLLNGEDNPEQTRFACTLQNAGAKAVEVVEITYQATHMIETCSAPGESFTNDYWITGDQKIRKSRQWISPDLGYITIADVRR